jgi:4-alpha-glucanotransferase
LARLRRGLSWDEIVTEAALHALADAAGIAVRWRNVQGEERIVSPDTLTAVLRALGHGVDSEAEITDSVRLAREIAPSLPPLVTALVGDRIHLPVPAARSLLVLEDGRSFDSFAEADPHGCSIPPILEPGYHRLSLGDREICLAVAPRRCTVLRDLVPGGRAVTLAAQLYALRRKGDGGIGDFAALGDFVEAAAQHNVQGVAISPVHAQFSADLARFGPYAPSSRVALNVLHAPLDPIDDAAWRIEADALEAGEFVDWPRASALRLKAARAVFEKAASQPRVMAAFAKFRIERGEGLERHAVFEALHAHLLQSDPGLWHWRNWPEALRDCGSADTARLAGTLRREVDFHAFLQFLADRGLADAQARARRAGMGIGLISDLAVGTDGGGSHCWARPLETLLGLTVGAPPDMFQRAGQNWGLAAFSPRGLVACGFTAFLEMLRSALAHAGGVRIDHSMGLHRLWVVPEGAGATEGAYLHFPETDLLRLIALESHRARAIVVAEDLGTLPEGFQGRLQEAGVSGMRVLWFERDRADHFTNPSHWTRQAAAMTTTHDLPTVAGWWQGRDIDWRETLDPTVIRAEADAERTRERQDLWRAMRDSGAAQGVAPAPDAPAKAVDAAIAHVAGSACDLMILPLEDVLGLVEQPNLPNTVDEHPNWRRRLPGMAGDLLEGDVAGARLRVATRGRKS